MSSNLIAKNLKVECTKVNLPLSHVLEIAKISRRTFNNWLEQPGNLNPKNAQKIECAIAYINGIKSLISTLAA